LTALLAPAVSVLEALPTGAAGGAEAIAGAATTPPVTTPPVTLGGAAVRPPAIPLAVRSPYLSTWLPSTSLAGTTPQFWYGSPRSLVGLIRVDGKLYTWAGEPAVSGVAPPAMVQRSLQVTATQSIFTSEAGGVELVASFLSPVEPGDLRLQSVPFTLLTVSVTSVDRSRHSVQLYAEITGEWASSDESELIEWQISEGHSGRYWTIGPQDQQPLTENLQMAQWGRAVWGVTPGPGSTYQSGDVKVRSQFARHGKLANLSDSAFRAVGDDQPLFAFAQDLGEIGFGSVEFVLGHVRTPLVGYGSVDSPPLCGDQEPPACGSAATPLLPLWTRYWAGWESMADDFLDDAPAARQRAVTLDAKIESAATEAAGPGYSAICALSLRQCYGGTELVVGPHGDPWLMGKEISSDGDVNTVDIFDQAYLAWLWLDPELVPLIMAPILDWCASPTYQNDATWLEVPASDIAFGTRFCVHDLGVYPLANGDTPFNQEQMPIEECAGMLIMAASYARKVGAAKAKPFLEKWHMLWTQWAEYLRTQVPTPQTQLTTNDWVTLGFEPSTADVNLGAKALIGLLAAGQIAAIVGDEANTSTWTAAAEDNVGEWVSRSTDISGTHLNLEQGAYGTWTSLYNAYYQRVLGVELIPEKVAAMQASFYLTKLTPYGMPMQTDTEINKVAWLIFIPAWLETYPICAQLMARNVAYINDTPTRVAYDDRYNTVSGVGASGIAAHPTLGAVFAFLAAR